MKDREREDVNQRIIRIKLLVLVNYSNESSIILVIIKC